MTDPRVSVLLPVRDEVDDVALPERLEVQVAAIEEEGLAAVGGRVEYFPEPTDGLRAYAGWLNSLVTVEAAARTSLAALVEVDPRKLGKRIHGAPVVPVERAGDFPGATRARGGVGAGGEGAERELAAGLGLVEGRDFVAVA